MQRFLKLLSICILSSGSVSFGSPSKDAITLLKDVNREKYWPDFSCVPGWIGNYSEVIKTLNTSNETTRAILNDILEGVALLEEATSRCKSTDCDKMCILVEMGLVTKGGNLIPISESTNSLANFFKDGGGMEKDVIAGAILARIHFLSESRKLKLDDPALKCEGDSAKLFDIIDEILKLSCDKFPPEMESFQIPLEKVDFSSYFPKFECDLGGMHLINESTSLEELSPGMRKLLTINRNCHAEFDQFEYIMKRSGSKGVKICIQACILERIHVISPTGGTYLNRTFDYDFPERTEEYFLTEFELKGTPIPEFGYWMQNLAWRANYWVDGLGHCWGLDEHTQNEWMGTMEMIDLSVKHACWNLKYRETYNWTVTPKMFREDPFPRLNCVPGWQDYKEATQPLIKQGQRTPEQNSLFVKLSGVRRGFGQVVHCFPSRERTDEVLFSLDRCVKHCILSKFGILVETDVDGVKTWHLGLQPRTGKYIMKHYLDEGNVKGLSTKYIAEATASYLITAINSTDKLSISEILQLPCEDNKWTQVFDFVDTVATSACGSIFPPPTSLFSTKVTVGMVRNDTQRKGYFWPDMTCVRGWYDVGQDADLSSDTVEELSSGVRLLYKINRDCRADYRSDRFFALQGRHFPSEMCTKVCVLSYLKVLNTKGKFTYDLTYDLGNVDEVANVFGRLLSDDGNESEEGRQVGVKFFEMVRSSFEEYGLDGVRCHDERKWLPLLAEVDEFFMDECDANPIGTHWLGKTSVGGITGRTEVGEHLLSAKNNGFDFSCYTDFVQDETSVLELSNLGKECEQYLEKAGIVEGCYTGCLLHKMGLFTWDKRSGTHLQLRSVQELAKSLEKFSTQNKESSNTVLKIATRIREKCLPAWQKVEGLSCANLATFEDCIERVLSCKYDGHFLRKGQPYLDKAPGESALSPSPSPADKCSPTFQGKLDYIAEINLMDLSCRHSFQTSVHTEDYRGAVGRLRRMKVKCISLLQHGYNDCEEECILEVLGVIAMSSMNWDGRKMGKSYKLNEEEDMVRKLNNLVLTGEGGKEASNFVAEIISKNCGKYFPTDKGLANNCTAQEWRNGARCIRAALDCTPSNLYRNW